MEYHTERKRYRDSLACDLKLHSLPKHNRSRSHGELLLHTIGDRGSLQRTLFRSQMTEGDILAMVAKASEFEQVKVREEEANELKDLLEGVCVMRVKGGTENSYGKANILMQTHISRAPVETFSFVSQMQVREIN